MGEFLAEGILEVKVLDGCEVTAETDPCRGSGDCKVWAVPAAEELAEACSKVALVPDPADSSWEFWSGSWYKYQSIPTVVPRIVIPWFIIWIVLKVPTSFIHSIHIPVFAKVFPASVPWRPIIFWPCLLKTFQFNWFTLPVGQAFSNWPKPSHFQHCFPWGPEDPFWPESPLPFPLFSSCGLPPTPLLFHFSFGKVPVVPFSFSFYFLAFSFCLTFSFWPKSFLSFSFNCA